MKAFLISVLFFSVTTGLAQKKDFPGGRGEGIANGRSIVYEFKNGRYASYRNGKLYVEGSYITKGKYLIVIDENGAGACLVEGLEVGIYTWEFSKDKVLLKVIDDDCLGRQSGFVFVALSKN